MTLTLSSTFRFALVTLLGDSTGLMEENRKIGASSRRMMPEKIVKPWSILKTSGNLSRPL